jgi:hypothetical protein
VRRGGDKQVVPEMISGDRLELPVPAMLFLCTIGEGEGPRFNGRMVSVNEHELCVRPTAVRLPGRATPFLKA